MKRFPVAALFAPLLLSLAASGAAPNQPNLTKQIAPRPMPKAEWLDPNRSAPNGTQYRTFTSAVLGREVSYLVWLPPGYTQESTHYPVIYFLHGRTATQSRGAITFVPHIDAAIKEGKLPPCIVILVNGMVSSFYCDATDGKVPMESVIIKDLIPHVDATYRTFARREGRIIEGYSMGGFGAARLGFKYPALFGTVVINAGSHFRDPALADTSKDNMLLATFGGDRERYVAENPRTLARRHADQLRATHIRIGCGSEDGLLADNRELHELLTQLAIPHDYEIVPGVAHDAPTYYQKLGTVGYGFHRKSLAALLESTK